MGAVLGSYFDTLLGWIPGYCHVSFDSIRLQSVQWGQKISYSIGTSDAIKPASSQTPKTQQWYHPSFFHASDICPAHVSLTALGSQLSRDTYIRIIRDDTQRSGNGNHIEDGEESMARRPAEVLVAVCVNFCECQPTILYAPCIVPQSQSIQSYAWVVSTRNHGGGSTVVFLQGRVKDQRWTQLAPLPLARLVSRHSHLLGPAMVDAWTRLNDAG